VETNDARAIAPARFERSVDQDRLCGVATRHALIERLETLSALSPNAPLSFVLIKVHGLADTNRLEGFQAGDAVLKDVATTVKALVRATDMIGRFTSSSFGVVLQGAGATAAGAVAARFDHHLNFSGPNRVTIAVSVATGRGLNATALPLAAVDSLAGAS
jgi:diguanylate cyclase (GGDEF)-like protein